MPKSLSLLWNRERRRAHRANWVMRVRVVVAFALAPVASLLGAMISDSMGIALMAIMINLTVLVMAALYMRRTYRGILDRALAPRNSVIISSEAVPAITALIARLSSLMLREHETIQIRVATADHSVGASVISWRHITHIILPLGYLKVFELDRGAAEAILAHELSHIAQGDSRLWLVVEAYVRTIHKILIPVAWITAGVALIIAVVNGAQIGLGDLLRLASGPILLWAFGYSARVIRRRSEFAADLGAAASVGIEATCSALRLICPSSENLSDEGYVALKRLKRIESFHTGKTASSAALAA